MLLWAWIYKQDNCCCAKRQVCSDEWDSQASYIQNQLFYLMIIILNKGSDILTTNIILNTFTIFLLCIFILVLEVK